MKFSKEKHLNSCLIILIVFFLFGINSSVYSILQEPEQKQEAEFKYEDDDLIKFVEANQEISELRREVNNDISEIVEDAGLTMERFNQVARAAQIGALDEEAYSSEEIEAFNQVAPMVNELRNEMRNMMQAILAEKELGSELYQEILQDYRQDRELQVHVRDLLRERARERAFEKRKQELIEEKGLTEEEAEEIIIRRSEKKEEN